MAIFQMLIFTYDDSIFIMFLCIIETSKHLEGKSERDTNKSVSLLTIFTT